MVDRGENLTDKIKMPFLQLRDNKTEAAEEQERDKGENESSNDAGHLGWIGKKWKTEDE